MNMTVLYKKCTYRLLLITTTLIGLGLNFSSAGSYTYTGSVNLNRNSTHTSLFNRYTLNLPIPITNSSLSFKVGDYIDNINCIITNTNSTNFSVNYINGMATYIISNNQSSNNSFQITTNNINGNYDFNINFSNLNGYPYIFQLLINGNANAVGNSLLSFDYSCTFEGDNIINQSDLGGGTCDYSDYELKSDITENYCKNKFSNFMTSSECDSLYSGYVSPTLYQNCTNSLNSCSGELGVCNSNLGFCLNGNYSGDIQWSSLWINNIQHLGNKNIYIEIPEEIERDYVNIDDETDIEITGYGYDQNAMQEMVNTQFTPPTSTDMEEIIAKIANFLPLLAVGLLFIWTWYIIKKVFRKGF